MGHAVAMLKAAHAIAELIDFPDDVIVLLRHKFPRAANVLALLFDSTGIATRCWAGATISRRRMVAIEFGMWRSVRSGGAAGSVTGGNGKFFEQPGGTRS